MRTLHYFTHWKRLDSPFYFDWRETHLFKNMLLAHNLWWQTHILEVNLKHFAQLGFQC